VAGVEYYPGDVGQRRFEGVDGPAGADVFCAVEDEGGDGEVAAGGGEFGFSPGVHLFVDGGVALMVDAEPWGGHLLASYGV
jgi:hypothetical protein